MTKVHTRVISFLMCFLVVLTVCVFQPLNKPKAALPVVLVPALVAVFSLAAAVGINFAVNAIAGETPTAQNNIAVAIINRLDELNNTLHPTNALVKNLINQLSEKDPARVSTPDPVTGKSTYNLTMEEWKQTRAAWYEHLGNPFINGTLPVEVDGDMVYLEYTHDEYGLDHNEAASQVSDLLGRRVFEWGKGLEIQLDTDYKIHTTWQLDGDEYIERRLDDFIFRVTYNSTSKQLSIISRNLTTGYEYPWNVTVGVSYGKTLYGIEAIRLVTFRNTNTTSTAYNGVYIAVDKDTNDTGASGWALIRALPNQGTSPISQSTELADAKWWDLGNVTSGTTEGVNTDIPYKVAPDLTGTDKVKTNWEKAIALDPANEEQPFTIDFEAPDVMTPSQTIPETLTEGVSTAELDLSEYDFPELNRPTMKALFISKFPFCLPWDLAQAVKIYQAPAEAPNFEVDFLAPIKEQYHIEGDTTIRFDMENYAIVGEVIRWSMLILFSVGLIILTPKLIKY